MTSISQRKIKQIHLEGENSRRDYKLRYNLDINNVKDEFAKDSCAIANFLYQTSGHGYLIIGSDDEGNPIGVNHSDYQEERIQQILDSRTDPPPTCEVLYEKYEGSDLVIIRFRRNPFGPHQVKKNGKLVGFPIRRGSTTGLMTTNEVFQAMQSRARTFTRQKSEYETLSLVPRYRRIMRELKEGLIELGVPESSIEDMSYNGFGRTAFTYHPARDYIKVNKNFNSKDWNIFLSVHPENASQRDLFGVDGSIEGFLEENSLPIHKSIVVHFVHGNISSSYFTNREKNWGDFVRVNIESRIIYFGAGEGVRDKLSFIVNLPKFFVSHIKSKDDMKTRIELIFNWIEQHPQMFEDIRKAYNS